MPPRFAPLALALATLLPCAGHAADAGARPSAPEPARPVGPPLVISTDIGDDIDDVPAWLAKPGVLVHLYGKTEARPGRKMGHITQLFD